MISGIRSLFLILFGAIAVFSKTALADSKYPLIHSLPSEEIWATPKPLRSDLPNDLWPRDVQFFAIPTAGSSAGAVSALNAIPGIQARDSGSPTISLRGSSQASRTLTLLHGVPLQFADGLGASLLLLPTEIIEGAEIIRGPGSVYYGANAMGGVLNFQRREFPRPSLRLSASDDTGKLGTTSTLYVQPWRLKRGNFQTSIFHENAPGEFNYRLVSDPSMQSRRSKNNKSLLRATSSGQARWGGWQIQPQWVVAREIGTTPGSVNSPYALNFQNWGALGGVNWSKPMTEKSDFMGQTSAGQLVYHYENPNSRSIVSRVGQKLSYSTPIRESDRLQTFVDYQHHEYTDTFSGSQLYVENPVELGNIWSLPISAVWSLQPGYRYAPQYGAIFKQMGFFYDQNPHHLWLTYAEGFRAPSLSDRFANMPEFTGNSSLRPERSEQYELGFHFDKTRRYLESYDGLNAKFSLYMIRYYDIIDSVPGASALTTTRANRGSARTFGLESMLGYGWSIFLAEVQYAHTDARNLDLDQPLKLVPKHQFTITLNAQLGPVIFELKDVYWSRFSEQKFGDSSPRELNAANSFDFGLRTTALSDWEISASVQNIFDEPRELTIGYPEPQRRFNASIMRFF